MNAYHIADLERLTGIKAHTIRIWEKRYKLISPRRTDTNIRVYDDEQVKKLLKVSTLLEKGIKISHIAAMNEKQLNGKIHELETSSPEDVIINNIVNELISSMLGFDEAAFEKTFASAVVRFGLYNTIEKIIYPFLNRTGLMWSSSDAMPVQEHFASAIIRRKLIAAIDGVSAPSKKSKSFVLFLPEEEWHETGLLFADYLIRSKGYKTVYLSQNVPFRNLQEVIRNIRPSHLLTFYITRQDPEKIQKELNELAALNKKCQLLVAGAENVICNVKKLKNLSLLHSAEELLRLL